MYNAIVAKNPKPKLKFKIGNFIGKNFDCFYFQKRKIVKN